MSTTSWVAGVIIIIAIIGGVWWYTAQPAVAPTNTTPTTDTTGSTGSPQTATSSAQTYTMAQVAAHKDAASCWTAVDNFVYDLTAWIPRHPGGERAILSICGIDGSAAFHGQHDDAKRQADILATFKIGALAQ